MAVVKTNAIRMLDGDRVAYSLHEYHAPDGFLDGISVAHAIGEPEEKVFKTLVTVGTSKQYYICMIPVASELDLKKAARHFGEKKLEMIPAKDITKVTGYVKGGCSPVGMKKTYGAAIHASAAQLEEIVVSAGKVGLQVKLPTMELARISGAEYADLTICSAT